MFTKLLWIHKKAQFENMYIENINILWHNVKRDFYDWPQYLFGKLNNICCFHGGTYQQIQVPLNYEKPWNIYDIHEN